MQILFIAVIAYFLYFVQRRLYAKYWDSNLDVKIGFQKSRVVEGERTQIVETVVNDKWLPLPFFYIRFKLHKGFVAVDERNVSNDDKFTRNDFVNVMMKQRIEKTIEVRCDKRGSYRIDEFSITANNLFLDEEYITKFDCDSEITVYPKTVDITRFENLLRSFNGNQSISRSLFADPFLVRGVREYQTFDEMRLINWKATAKTGDLKVNIMDTTIGRDGYIYVNLERESLSLHDEVLEESIRLAKSFSILFSGKGIKSCVMTNATNGVSSDLIAVEKPDAGYVYESRVNEALTQICLPEVYREKNSRNDKTDFVECYGTKLVRDAQDGLIVLISNSRVKRLREIMYRLKEDGRAFVWIVPVGSMSDYVEDVRLKGFEYVWRLNYEGASSSETAVWIGD